MCWLLLQYTALLGISPWRSEVATGSRSVVWTVPSDQRTARPRIRWVHGKHSISTWLWTWCLHGQRNHCCELLGHAYVPLLDCVELWVFWGYFYSCIKARTELCVDSDKLIRGQWVIKKWDNIDWQKNIEILSPYHFQIKKSTAS